MWMERRVFLSGHVSPSGRRREPGVVLCGNNKENSCPECKESVFLTQIERTEEADGNKRKNRRWTQNHGIFIRSPSHDFVSIPCFVREHEEEKIYYEWAKSDAPNVKLTRMSEWVWRKWRETGLHVKQDTRREAGRRNVCVGLQEESGGGGGGGGDEWEGGVQREAGSNGGARDD